MATVITYSQRIEGRLHGPPAQNKDEIAAFKALLGTEPKPGGGAGWPHGFVEQGFKVVHWFADAAVGGDNKDETVLSFVAEVSTVRSGKVYDNLETLSSHNEWFHSRRDQTWYKDLKAKLTTLNESMKEKLIDRVWFRAYDTEDGDGSDS